MHCEIRPLQHRFKLETLAVRPSKYSLQKVRVEKLVSPTLIPYLHSLWTWLLTLRPFANWGECGTAADGIVAWMMYHNFPLVGVEKTKYGSSVLIDPTVGDVLGVASLVPDDRGVGQELKDAFGANPTGFWGGVYIRDHLQGAGLGGHLCRILDAEIQARVDETGEEEEWYLFTRNPHAQAIYLACGFEMFRQDYHVKTFDATETVFRKVYRRKKQPA